MTEPQTADRAFADDERARVELLAEVRLLRVERAQLQAELELPKQTFERIFDACPTAISVHSFPDLVYREVNRVMTVSGCSQKELIGHSPQALAIWTETEHIDQFVAAINEKGYIFGFETVLNLGGAPLPGLLSGRLVELDGSRRVVINAHVITRLKQTERELIAARGSPRLLARRRSRSSSRVCRTRFARR